MHLARDTAVASPSDLASRAEDACARPRVERLLGSFGAWLFDARNTSTEDATLGKIRIGHIAGLLLLHVGLVVSGFIFSVPWFEVGGSIGVAVDVLALWLARRGRHRLAMNLSFWEGAALVIGAILMYDRQAGSVFYLFPGALVVFLDFRKGERGPTFTALGLCIVVFAVGPEGVATFTADPRVANVTPAQVSGLFWSNLFGSLATTLWLASYFASVNTAAELRLATEFERSERLLGNILPAAIAERLKQRAGTIADSLPSVSVVFADIVGFTGLAARISSDELVEILNHLFSRFDALADRFGLEKIKTIGDAYMAVAGAPDPLQDHAACAVEMALAMQAAVQEYSARAGHPIDVRIGVHTGPVIAGVIGVKKFTYDLWGATVNAASRMESHGEAGRIHVSAATHALLADRYSFTDRGVISVKGIGEMRTFFLLGRAAEGGR
jgi:class 3 adenylate cyclase